MADNSARRGPRARATKGGWGAGPHNGIGAGGGGAALDPEGNDMGGRYDPCAGYPSGLQGQVPPVRHAPTVTRADAHDTAGPGPLNPPTPFKLGG
jgi:hypothetical protein